MSCISGVIHALYVPVSIRASVCELGRDTGLVLGKVGGLGVIHPNLSAASLTLLRAGSITQLY